MNKIFDGQPVIISGGLGDIGFATAEAFALKGASIALGDIYPENTAEPFLKKLRARGVSVDYAEVDVANENKIKQWIDGVEETLGVPQLIIANAAIVNRAGIHEITPDQWRRELDVNLNGAFFLVQTATGRPRERS